jgi:hypothetical protein
MPEALLTAKTVAKFQERSAASPQNPLLLQEPRSVEQQEF